MSLNLLILERFPDENSLIKIGLPNGRLKFDNSLLGLDIPKPSNREIVITRKRLLCFYGRPQDYPKMIAMGDLDLAVVGSDQLDGTAWQFGCEILERFPQPNVSMVLASVSGEIPEKELIRVATSYPFVARNYFGAQGIPHVIYQAEGSIEGLINHGIADVILDVTETGKTLRDNGLKVIKNLGPLYTYIIGRKAC